MRDGVNIVRRWKSIFIYVNGKLLLTYSNKDSIRGILYRFVNWQTLLGDVVDYSELVISPNKPIKDIYRSKDSKARDEISEYLKTTPKKMHRRFRQFVQEIYLNPVEDLIIKHCTVHVGGKAIISWAKVAGLIINEKKIRQLIADKQEKFIPLVLQGMELDEIRKRLGKGLWKRLCAQPASRLKKVPNAYNAPSTEVFLNTPTTLITLPPWNIAYSEQFYDIIKKEFKLKDIRMGHRQYMNPERQVYQLYSTLYNLWNDYFIMSLREYPDLKPKIPKSIEQVNLWHDRLVEKINLRKYSKDVITFNVGTYEYDGWIIKPLLSKYDLHREGKEMHHCIASYADRVEEKRYYVLSISKEDKRYTMGIFLGWDVTVDQIQSACNRGVKTEDEVIIEVLKSLTNALIIHFIKRIDYKFSALLNLVSEPSHLDLLPKFEPKLEKNTMEDYGFTQIYPPRVTPVYNARLMVEGPNGEEIEIGGASAING